ncbi:uncharacterized protein LOC143024430 [Oratosquilla oratoria]|uniref:uncharacterized protein LOC143024430 n=1 Tax=Oratosquilla oratoria TaxID=337810 RepID=UPI003F75F6E7
MPKTTTGYTNLTDLTLTPEQEELLNLGLNLSEAGKFRGSTRSNLIQRKHYVAAHELKENKEITIRKADKSSALVLIPTTEYLSKLDAILEDPSKFRRITRNPVETLKRKVNQVLDTVNAVTDKTHIRKLTGDFDLGYVYGNVKTHKAGNPLRPIISQIPTPTYRIAKYLNEILTPYTPSAYSLLSSKDFLDILKGTPAPEGSNIASLDAESLYTNINVDRTIKFIIQRVYHNDNTPTLDIPEHALRSLLQLCTKEVPFRSPRGHMYVQTDGVAMGSPLGVLFANFFMGTIEEKILSEKKPNIYCRYIDDIFVRFNTADELEDLRQRLMEESDLTFTIENTINGSLPFLDIQVSHSNTGYKTSVYVKSTNDGRCLNGQSECPVRYKKSTINAYVRRALTHCSDWTSAHHKLERTSHVLVNNGFPNYLVEKAIKDEVDRWYLGHNSHTDAPNKTPIKLFYKSHMTSAHKTEEKVIKNIIRRNILRSSSCLRYCRSPQLRQMRFLRLKEEVSSFLNRFPTHDDDDDDVDVSLTGSLVV